MDRELLIFYLREMPIKKIFTRDYFSGIKTEKSPYILEK
jgi:hypothetical protein